MEKSSLTLFMTTGDDDTGEEDADDDGEDDEVEEDRVTRVEVDLFGDESAFGRSVFTLASIFALVVVTLFADDMYTLVDGDVEDRPRPFQVFGEVLSVDMLLALDSTCFSGELLRAASAGVDTSPLTVSGRPLKP